MLWVLKIDFFQKLLVMLRINQITKKIPQNSKQ